MQDRRYTRPAALRYITRSDSKRYWRVQFVRGLTRAIQVYFTDAAYGGGDPALQEAQKFRDQVVKIHSPDVPSQRRRNMKHMAKSEAYVGIRLREDKRKGRNRNFAWFAAYMEGATERRRSWSIRKHGYQQAFRLASEFRHKMTGQPIGPCPPAPPHIVRWLAEEGVF